MRSAWCGIILGVLASCSGKNGELTPPRCASDADCGMDFRCERAIDRPVVGMIPCPGERACTAASDCADVEVCAPSWQVAPDKVGCTDLLCGAPCSTGSCPDDATCGDAGSCELIPCDASPDSPACPEHWRCDPEAAKTENPGYLSGVATLEPDIARAIGHGCARIPCDEPNGYECADLYACRSAPGTAAPACLPESCLETGRCANDDYLVCLSESKHPNFEPDQHDCVTRGCDEGHSCSTISARGVDIGYCDYSAPNAEPTLGCAIRLCESDADCADLQACDPEGPFADGQGCRDLSCVEGRPCPSGWLCDLGKTADISGCYDPGSLPSGGTGGGGTSGSGGTTGSSGGVAGSRNGQCVRR